MVSAADATAPESAREIVLTRTFDAPRELVWEAYTTPDTSATGGVETASPSRRTRWTFDATVAMGAVELGGQTYDKLVRYVAAMA